MEPAKKITLYVPAKLLKRAQKASGLGITPTIRKGLELVAASDVYEQLRALRGKVKFDIDLNEMREDRDYASFGLKLPDRLP